MNDKLTTAIESLRAEEGKDIDKLAIKRVFVRVQGFGWIGPFANRGRAMNKLYTVIDLCIQEHFSITSDTQ